MSKLNKILRTVWVQLPKTEKENQMILDGTWDPKIYLEDPRTKDNPKELD